MVLQCEYDRVWAFVEAMLGDRSDTVPELDSGSEGATMCANWFTCKMRHKHVNNRADSRVSLVEPDSMLWDCTVKLRMPHMMCSPFFTCK